MKSNLIFVSGIFVVLASSAGAQNIVLNGMLTDPPIVSGTDWPDWILGPGGDPGVYTGLGGPDVPNPVEPENAIPAFPDDPNFLAFGSFESLGAGTISQDLSTVAGQEYTITFWMADNSTDYGSAEMFVNWGGNLGLDVTSLLQTPYTWQEVSLNVLAAGPMTDLQFAGYKNSGFYEITDISVTPTSSVPAPMAVTAFALGVWPAMRRRYSRRRSLTRVGPISGGPTDLQRDEAADQKQDPHDRHGCADRFLHEVVGADLHERGVGAHQEDLPDAGDDADDQEVLDRRLQVLRLDIGEQGAE